MREREHRHVVAALERLRVEHAIGRAARDRASVAQHQHVVGVARREVHVVHDGEHGGAGVARAGTREREDRVLLARIPGTKGQPHTTIVGGGHFLQEDKGEELAEVVVEFMKSTTVSGE